MSEKEKKIAQNLAKALNAIPDDKKEYFLGFAEGVEAAVKQKKAAKAERLDEPG